MMEKEQLEAKIAETQSILDSLKAALGSSEESAPEEDPSFSDMVEHLILAQVRAKQS